MTPSSIARLMLAVCLPFAAPLSAAKEAPTECAKAAAEPGADADSIRFQCEVPPEHGKAVATAEYIGHIIPLSRTTQMLALESMRKDPRFMSALNAKDNGSLIVQGGADDDIRVVFYSGRGPDPVVIAEATLDRKYKVKTAQILGKPRPLDETEANMHRALRLALAQHPRECGDWGFEEYVYPMTPFMQTGWLVVLVSRDSQGGTPVGGHHVYVVDHQGEHLDSAYSQTQDCSAVTIDGLGGTRSVGVIHDTSDTPTGFHVLNAWQAMRPYFVLTTKNDLVWKIENNHIALAASDAPQAVALRKAYEARTAKTAETR